MAENMPAVDNAELATDNVAQNPGNPPAPPANTPADSGTAPAEDAAEEPKTDKGPGNLQKSFNRLTRQRGAAERRALAAEARLAELEAQVGARTNGSASPQSAQVPRKEQFTTYEEYVAAYAAHAAREAIRNESQATQTQQAQAEATEAQADAEAELIERGHAEAAQHGIDFEEAWETLKSAPRLSPRIAQFLYESDHPAVMASFLADNPNELNRISLLPASTAKRELEKAEAKLTAKSSPRNTTRAPAPVSTVNGSGSPTGGMPKATDINAWMEWRKALKD